MMWPNFGVKREEGWMSVVRLGERIDLAHVIRPAGKRPEIRLGESFRMEGLPRDALARLAQNKGLKRYRCASLLGESQYRVAQLEAPSVPPEERVQALRWRLKDMVDFPVDGASIAVADIPAEGSRQANVFAIVAPREVIAERMALFHVASLFEEPNRGLAFLVLNSGESLLTITYGGELYLSRRIEVSSQALAETDEERRQQMLERLALELQRTLDNFDRQYGFISVSRLLVCSEFDCAAAVAGLAQNLYLPVQVADLAQVVEFSGVPELRSVERQAQCLLAIGAALRSDA